jgi:hypothetical protein
MRLFALSIFAASIGLAGSAHATDVTAPVIAHTPVTAPPQGDIHIQAKVTDESKVFPQVFWRVPRGTYASPIDMKPVRGEKHMWSATIPRKDTSDIEYYLEAYDEYGNGPARAGDVDAPIKVGGAPAVAAAPPPPPAPAPVVHAAPPPAAKPPEPAPAVAQQTAPAAKPASTAAPAPAPVRAPPIAVGLQRSGPPTRLGATWRSAVIPGWGQWATGHPVRGAIFAGLGAITLGSAVTLGVRARQANDIYENASFSMRNAAYDQAASYSTSRNLMIAATVLVWAASAADAYFFYQP